MLTCLHWLCPILTGPQPNTAELAEFSVGKIELSLSPDLLHYQELLEVSVFLGRVEKLPAALLLLIPPQESPLRTSETLHQ